MTKNKGAGLPVLFYMNHCQNWGGWKKVFGFFFPQNLSPSDKAEILLKNHDQAQRIFQAM